ncbi:efflux RND transporter periplasmic adaptor subunit [Azospirillum brasilense]|uniref:Efflux RND transporter periplasmic adaptor subunit n=1 Tax=Azospirillum brasilense TaxID=192 RepID=A0A0P0EXV0_AZOBR|nr:MULTISPECIES: efflux RND transporter periplasmic adaptor subunit [Azospirillum]ALJ37325.1 hemolysin D [Azospirillum brasilense]MDW7552054.1 efflux RND transporter periplasmic adaptor subunit [Azospirillum brasilense]MDW7591489.1 efflux RND transporter periplasmic adaptor subunit [Azospirillum brasilense]MDW7626659.1 efflux RND transporter periplasmic adaptor subunit [Azospirillum brasilense]MDX5950992.1 efflux RND transporter periplasmic adaptor subunit [Azospirillum brasilense]
MRHTLRIVALLVLVALGGGAYWYFVKQGGTINTLLAGKVPSPGGASSGAPAAGGPPGSTPPMPVEALPVKVGTVSRQVTAVGSLLSSESVVIRPEVAGKVSEIAFLEGQAVKKGAVLIRLDDSIARATLAQAQASIAFSRAELSRAEELYRQRTGPARNREQALAKLQSDEATVQLAKAQLEKLTLTAPFDGVLGLRKVSVGDVVAAGKDIVNLEAIETLKLDFRVPELYLPTVRTGQTLKVAVDSFGGRTFDGTVYAIDPLVDVNGRAVVIRARVPNKDGALRPGLFARVALTLDQTPNAVLVPEQSVSAFGNRQFVFKVVDGKAVQTTVTLGERRNAEVEITAGLQPGDVVVTAGQLKIRDGAPVVVVNNKPAGS